MTDSTADASEASKVGPRLAELLLSPFQEGIEDAIRKHKGLTRHCGLNAIRGLKRAWLVAGIDPEIALFRAVTAEEEAAAALISALQRRHYPGARKLSRWRHPDKAGLMVFIRMLGGIFASSGWPKPMLQLQKDQDPPRIDVHLPSDGLGLGPGHRVTPDEPLNLMISEGGDGGPTRIMTFAEQLEEIAHAGGANSILLHIREEANFRNRLLYASDNGIMVVNQPDAFILERQRNVFVLLGLVIIILQTPMHQLLAKQALEAYLAALDVQHDDAFDYTVPGPPPDVLIEVRKEAGSPAKAAIRRRTERGGEDLAMTLSFLGDDPVGIDATSAEAAAPPDDSLGS